MDLYWRDGFASIARMAFAIMGLIQCIVSVVLMVVAISMGIEDMWTRSILSLMVCVAVSLVAGIWLTWIIQTRYGHLLRHSEGMGEKELV